MCTVVFIPGNKGYNLASLRDENPERPVAFSPEIFNNNTTSFLFPKDALAGGTWIGTNSIGNSIVLLNGGFKSHQRATCHRKSRGLIVVDLLACEKPVAAWNILDLKDIDPFTLIVWSNKQLHHLIWDGIKKYSNNLNTSKHYIWSSSTLYNAIAKDKRQTLYEDWVKTIPTINEQTLLSFFNSFEDKVNGFIINRNEQLKTLSYTFLEVIHNKKITMSYNDFLNNTNNKKSMPLKKSQ